MARAGLSNLGALGKTEVWGPHALGLIYILVVQKACGCMTLQELG